MHSSIDKLAGIFWVITDVMVNTERKFSSEKVMRKNTQAPIHVGVKVLDEDHLSKSKLNSVYRKQMSINLLHKVGKLSTLRVAFLYYLHYWIRRVFFHTSLAFFLLLFFLTEILLSKVLNFIEFNKLRCKR